MAKTPEVASLKVRPVRSAAIQSAFGTHTPDVVPFHVKMMPRSKKKTFLKARGLQERAAGCVELKSCGCIKR